MSMRNDSPTIEHSSQIATINPFRNYADQPRRVPARRGVARLARIAGFTLPTLGLIVALGGMIALTLGTGCASKKPAAGDAPTAANMATGAPSTPSATALDVHPAPAGAAYAPPTPGITLPPDPVVPPTSSLGQDPILTQTPRLASAGTDVPTTPATGSAAPTASGSTGTAPAGGSTAASTYTVQKGDTLFKIARDHYGNGKAWTRIAAANPGLSPTTLKAGQRLNLP